MRILGRARDERLPVEIQVQFMLMPSQPSGGILPVAKIRARDRSLFHARFPHETRRKYQRAYQQISGGGPIEYH